MGLLEQILYTYIDTPFMIAEGFDEAVIGIEEKSMRLVYSMDKCLEILQRDMGYMEALEVYEDQVYRRYMVPNAPIFINDNF